MGQGVGDPVDGTLAVRLEILPHELVELVGVDDVMRPIAGALRSTDLVEGEVTAKADEDFIRYSPRMREVGEDEPAEMLTDHWNEVGFVLPTRELEVVLGQRRALVVTLVEGERSDCGVRSNVNGQVVPLSRPAGESGEERCHADSIADRSEILNPKSLSRRRRPGSRSLVEKAGMTAMWA